MPESDAPELTFAAEALGKVDHATAVPLLLFLSRHESPLVREGAIYGMGEHAKRDGVMPRLEEMARMDSNQTIRETAAEQIEIITEDGDLPNPQQPPVEVEETR